ncbi:MAG: hypothetical protein KDA53_06645 [Hyphomonas sp.]|nr:hypothetical protein [Hyphomonas sp.]
MEKLKLIPCYEGKPEGDAYPEFHALNGRLGETELVDFLRTVCSYGAPKAEVSSASEAAAFLTALTPDAARVLSGGLTAQKGAFKIEPSCCCGLEGWREWYWLLDGHGSPWLGHDPSPWVEAHDGQIVLHTDEGEQGEALTVPAEELAAALNQARADLEAFAASLRAWILRENVQDGQEMCNLLEFWFAIGEKNAEGPPVYGVAITAKNQPG